MVGHQVDEREEKLLEQLKLSIKCRPSDLNILAEHDLKLFKHYGIFDEMYDYVMNAKDPSSLDVATESVFAFRRKPNRVVWTEEEYRAKVEAGEISPYDVIQMADGFVPPQT